MSKLTIYHGSPEIIEKPQFGKGKTYNDYGRGFYCTEHIELAKEWACSNNETNGYANQYEIDLSDYKVLDLTDDGIQNGSFTDVIAIAVNGDDVFRRDLIELTDLNKALA